MKISTSNQIEKSKHTCPLCSSDTNQIIAKQLRRGNGLVAYCNSCDHGFLVHKDQINAKEYYGELYRQEYSHHAESTATNAREIYEVYKNYQQERLFHIGPLLNTKTNLLEVGASAGQFLVHVKDKVEKVHAIELDKACCEFLEKELDIEVASEFLENSKFAHLSYDIVCAFQVLEHVENPVAFIKNLKNTSKPGGYIYLEVPNLYDPLLSVWDVEAYRNFYYHSAHLNYFSEASLTKVALEAGFKGNQIEIYFSQDYNLLNHLHWIMNNSPQPDCLIGLNGINLSGINQEISGWLSQELKLLNLKYIEKLTASKCTSNLLMRIHNE